MATATQTTIPVTGPQKTNHVPALTLVEGGTPPSVKTKLNLAEHGWAAFHFEDDARARSFYEQYRIEPFVLYQDSDECFYLVRDPAISEAASEGEIELIDDYQLFRGDIYLPAHAPELIELSGSLDDVKPLPASLLKTKLDFPVCTATVVHAQEGVRLTKHFHTNDEGALVKDSAPQLSGGVAQTLGLPLDQLLELASNPSECLVLGAIKGQKPNSKPAPLTTTGRLAQVHEGDARAITRTKDSFTFPSDQACYAFIDHDPDEGAIPPIKSLCLDELIERITSAWPDCGVGTSAFVYTPSSTAGVRRSSDPAREQADVYRGSAHISLAFAPGVDPEAWMRTLYAKLIEAGQASAYITKMGHINVRTLIDQVVAQPCRVEYTAPAVLAKGVVRDELKRPEDVWQRHGGHVEVAAAALYPEELVKRIVETERKRLSGMPEVKERVEATLERVRQDAEAKYRATGTAPGDAERQAQDLVQRLREGGDKITLHANDPIELVLDDGTAVSVGAIFADMQAGGELYHERGCADPDSGQSGKAKIYYQPDNQQVWIHSFAGGGRNYVVVARDQDSAQGELPSLSSDPTTNRRIYELARLPPADLDKDRKQYCAELGLTSGVLKRTVDEARKQLRRKKSFALIEQTESENSQSVTTVELDGDGELGNLVQTLRREREVGYRIAYDAFYGDEVISPAGREEWRSVEDADMMELRLRLEMLGIEDVGKEKMRDAFAYLASKNRIDTAITWANSLPEWDGHSRVGNFYRNYLGCEDTAYSRAVGCYTWTALAGRLLDPGCKADMIPTWIGAQGGRKTTGLMGMVPASEHYAEISFGEDETELARKQRGKLVLEIAELSGFSKKEREAQKAWITRLHEEWTPKFKERMTRYARRSICIATTNVETFLQDPTGNRRWLPIEVGTVDVDRIIEDRDQLWAEAIAMYRKGGILWAAAEREAKHILGRHEVENPYIERIGQWLQTPQSIIGYDAPNMINEAGIGCGDRPSEATFLRLNDVAVYALGIKFREVPRYQARISEAMKTLGYHNIRRRHVPGKPSFYAWVPADVWEDEVSV
jgi:hypothetical protein